MKETRRRGSLSGRNRLLPALIIGLAAVILAALVIGGYGHKSSTFKPAATASPTPTSGLTADQTKGQFAPSVTKSANGTPPVAAATPSPVASANYVASFSISKRADGFHVATVLTGITGGTCKLTISPTNQATTSKTGAVMLSGQTYMCDFGGDIAGSGTTGSANLTVTAPDGTKANSDTTF